MFDFSKTEAAKSTNFLTPGIYRLKVKSVKYEKLSNEKGSEFLSFTFVTSDDVEFTEKFFLTEKALARIQYLHQAWTGKLCEKKFKSVEEIETYFAKLFTAAKAPSKNVIVGGQISKDKVYATLPYTDFVLDDDAELGEFKEGDAMWKKYVTKSNLKSETEGKSNTILNEVASEGEDKDGEEDMPW